MDELNRILAAVERHEDLKARTISLIPTENVLSPLASKVLASDLVNRYYLLDNTVWEYPQTDEIADITAAATTALSALYRTRHVNIRPISGLNCMTSALVALCPRGGTVYSISPRDGGHGATAAVAQQLGLRSRYLPFAKDDLSLNLPACAAAFQKQPADLVYIDQSNVLLPLVISDLSSLMPQPTLIYYDCSHLMGLMLDPNYFDPLGQGAIAIGGSFHKTFPGPQKGGIFCNDDALASRIQQVTDTLISSHHVNSVAALAVTAVEMQVYGTAYSQELRNNARALGQSMVDHGLPVHHVGSTITASHQVWVNRSPVDELPSDAIRRLREVNIVGNCARLPSLDGAKGLRFGATEITRLGMGEAEAKLAGELVADALFQRRSPERIRSDVQELRSGFQDVKFCLERSATCLGS